MSTRSAEATIKGYYYQFDTSILKLLELSSDSDSIVIEGIEDIDINTATEHTAIQCKYLSKPKFINSAVREPIILMLNHFCASTSPRIKYVLYAHFDEEIGGTEQTIDITRLKDILTYTENKTPITYYIINSITDAQLTSFLASFKFVFGKKFEDQQNEAIQKITSKLSCSEFEADTLHYNNALRLVIEKAILSDISGRTLTKRQFDLALSSSKRLFNEWYIRLRSKKEHLRWVSLEYKRTKAINPSRSKYIFIGKEILNADNSEMPIGMFIENMIHKYYRLGSCLRDAKPLTIVLNEESLAIREVKKYLIGESIPYNDGYEELNFHSGAFNAPSIFNTNNAGNKITKSSYLIKVLSKTTFEAHLSEINKPKVILHFSKDECLYEKSNDYQLFDIKYCDDLDDILSIIT